jgi:hypothetical protein
VIAIVVVAVAVAGIANWNLNLYFDDSNPSARASDDNTLAADMFAYDLKDRGLPYTIYYVAPPRLVWGGHPSATFIARNMTGINVDEPFTAADAPPELTGPTVFFFVPERRDELEIVQSWFPNGELVERTKEDGSPLFTEYFVQPNPS